MINRKIFIIFFLICVIVCFGCKVNKFESSKLIKSKCDSVNKFDLLCEDILNKKYIYSFIDTNKKDTYLMEDEIYKQGKIYFENSPNKTIVAKKESLIGKDVNKLLFSNYEINKDSTSVTLLVNFIVTYTDYGSPKEIDIKESKFSFAFDTLICKWKTIDSSTKFVR